MICDLKTITMIRMLSPGIKGFPAALILICYDHLKTRILGVRMDRDTTNWIDVDAAAQNMMLAVHELGLAYSPATSFSRAGVRQLLDLPDHLIPEYFVQLGYPAPMKLRTLPVGVSNRMRVEDLSFWHDSSPDEETRGKHTFPIDHPIEAPSIHSQKSAQAGRISW